MRLSRLPSLLRRLRARPGRDRVLLGLTAVTAIGTWGALRVVSFQRLLRWTDTNLDCPLPNDDPTIQRVLWAVEAVVPRLFPARPCLPQALTARFLLARRGIATDLRLGAAPDPDYGLRAHAWLERHGQVLTGGSDAPTRYVPFSVPSSSVPLTHIQARTF